MLGRGRGRMLEGFLRSVKWQRASILQCSVQGLLLKGVMFVVFLA